ncbi:S-layer family protein, partial [Limnohabitans sp. 2KL-51]|uniref:beta strand repeat-containing protein n=1 Tax=Limnohabitans sp. 2KL-51 TaxID=1977911 RepID=UPI000DD278D2
QSAKLAGGAALSTTSGPATITGQYGTLVMGTNGSYTYTVNNNNATVQALRTSGQTLTEVFSYTAASGTSTETASLVVTVQGANDAPTVVVQEADKSLTAGTPLSPFSILANFADVDSTGNGETATYTTSTLPSWLTFNATNGTFSGTPPSAGTTSVTVTRTDAAGLSVSDTFLIVVNPAVDTTAPKIAISSNQASLSTGQSATITFTVSEATSDFTWNGSAGDIVVTGGTLGALTRVGVNAAGEDIYIAVFTPTANSTTPGSIAVAAGKFTDAASNQNLDTYSASADSVAGHLVETNNIVNLSINTTTAAASLALANDSSAAVEAGGTANGTLGSNASGSVLSNDVGATPRVTGIQKISDSTATAVSAGTTGSTGTSIAGQYGTLVIGADGSYVYTVDNTNTTVQSLKGSTNTLTEVFTYTANDGTGAKTANLVVTVQGANDAPVAVTDVASATEAGGSANGTPGVNPTGNVLTNDTDVDQADTKAVSAILAGTSGTATPVTAANATADTTGVTGAYGTLKIGTDGSYSYTVNQSNAAVEALLPSSTPLTDTFTYTVKDAAGLTSTQTIVISINGATDASALNNSTATIDIVSATTDSGVSSSDFITNDQTLTYAGTITNWKDGLGDRVMLEFTDPVTGSITTAFVTPSSTGAWTWTDASRNPGTYILKATIVSATGTTAINTAAPVNGTNG